ncbi:MAG: efflux RND transporter permease subunit, partial [Pyrinomonadaceae bacterium]
MVDLDSQALYAKGLSATDVSNAVNAQNLIIPSGSIKIGDREYNVRLNSSTNVVDELNNLPIRQVNGTTIYIRDVAHVRDGFAVQSNIVRENGRRSSLLTILKSGNASTLDIVDRVKQVLPRIQSTLPPELNIKLLFDQSIFVRASLNGVLREGLIAACLTAAMILLFLGSWRSTLIVAISIPLSILCSIIAMRALGETLNVMTLGGLALAVGILVDDATVEIENIHRNLGQAKPMDRAILDGAQQIATPAFVSTLAICIVFVPVFFLSGSAKYLFSPLAEAVVFAMLASYILSRTLIPTLVKYLLRSEIDLFQHAEHEDEVLAAASKTKPDIFWRVHHRFNHYFERFRAAYRRTLDWCLNHRRAVVISFSLFALISFALAPFIGEDFFPVVDAGQFRLHVRAPSGTRIEETEVLFAQVEDVIRQTVPRDELETIIDDIGIPSGGVNLAFSDTVTIGPSDGEILVALKSDKHGSTPEIVKELREKLHTRFPQAEFFFQPADIVSQILNFGLPSPIDIQISGPNQNQEQNYAVANQIKAEIAKIQGTVDVHIRQVLDNPELRVNVDRTRADQIGLTQRDVANSLLISLSSSGVVSPNYWLNPQNGVSYLVAVQTPQYKIDSLSDLGNTPIVSDNQISNGTTGNGAQLLNNLATTERQTSVANVTHYNVQPVYDVYANVQGRDLGGVLTDVNHVVDEFKPNLPRGSAIVIRGQAESMRSSFIGLGAGLIFAAVLIYCLMVVNFQSWLDPLIIMMALPGALSGILWMLFVSQTTISVPSLMGAIM